MPIVIAAPTKNIKSLCSQYLTIRKTESINNMHVNTLNINCFISISFLFKKHTPATSRNEGDAYHFNLIFITPITEMSWVKEKFMFHRIGLHLKIDLKISLPIGTLSMPQ